MLYMAAFLSKVDIVRIKVAWLLFNLAGVDIYNTRQAGIYQTSAGSCSYTQDRIRRSAPPNHAFRAEHNGFQRTEDCLRCGHSLRPLEIIQLFERSLPFADPRQPGNDQRDMHQPKDHPDQTRFRPISAAGHQLRSNVLLIDYSYNLCTADGESKNKALYIIPRNVQS